MNIVFFIIYRQFLIIKIFCNFFVSRIAFFLTFSKELSEKSHKLFQYRINKSGPRTLPCGTQQFNVNGLLKTPFILTTRLLLAK